MVIAHREDDCGAQSIESGGKHKRNKSRKSKDVVHSSGTKRERERAIAQTAIRVQSAEREYGGSTESNERNERMVMAQRAGRVDMAHSSGTERKRDEGTMMMMMAQRKI